MERHLPKNGGKMKITLVVEKDGSISTIKVVQGIDERTDERMIRLLKKALNGRPVL